MYRLQISEHIERLVNFLKRDEDPTIEDVEEIRTAADAQEEDEDEQITEV